MFIYDDEMKLINECNYIQNKLQVFSIYLNIHSLIKEYLGASLGEEYIRGMMKAYLKVFLESLKQPITSSEFTSGLIRGIKRGNLVNNSIVEDILLQYENHLDLILGLMPYVDEINLLDCGINEKERFVIRVREILKGTLNNISACLPGWNKVVDLKNHVVSYATRYINDIIKMSKSLEEFQDMLNKIVTIGIFKAYTLGNIDYPFVILNFTGIFNQALSSIDYHLISLMLANVFVYGEPIKDYNFICSILGIKKEELLFRLKKLNGYIKLYMNNIDKGEKNI